ncbi:protein Sge1p [Trichomonascus vanleenenianus]|uniref:MDR family MFS transporter n=1 Tax=Trichomonascus vanleenenianus TaxID=2268995 RepID=UPI003EC9F9D5
MLLYALDQTIIATVLSTVGNHFHDFGKVSWIASAFFLPAAVFALSWSKVSLVFGRKWTVLVAIVLFELGSLICGLANSMNMLIVGRVIGGIGGGGIQVMVFIIITEITSIDKRGIAQGLIAASFGIASVVGPLVGGAFTTHVSWRWCFYINLPFGAIAFALIWIFFNPPPVMGSWKHKLAKIDYIGTALLTAGLVLVLLALTLGSTDHPWNSAIVIAFFTVGGILTIAFLAFNFFVSKHPLIPIEVARVPQVIMAALSIGLVYGGFMLSVLYLSTYYQVVKKADAMQSGIDLLPYIVPLVISALISGAVCSIFGVVKPFALIGVGMSCVGFGLLTTLDENSPWRKTGGYLILPGIGFGLSMQSSAIALQVAAPKRNGGVLLAIGLMNCIRSTGSVIASSLGQTIQTVVFVQKLKGVDIPQTISPKTLVNEPELIYQLPPEISDQIIKAFVTGFQRVMFTGLAFIVAGWICALFMTNKRTPPRPKKSDIEKDGNSSN